MEIIIGIVVAVVVATLIILAYIKGVRTGMSISKGEEPAKMQVPVIKTPKKEKLKKGEISLEDQLENMRAFEPKFTEE